MPSIVQVRGFCVDKSNLDVFDEVDVYGDMINSDIHHNCKCPTLLSIELYCMKARVCDNSSFMIPKCLSYTTV